MIYLIESNIQLIHQKKIQYKKIKLLVKKLLFDIVYQMKIILVILINIFYLEIDYEKLLIKYLKIEFHI